MPTTPNKGFSIPVTGSESGVWGSNDLNPNFSAIDSILGSITTLNLAGAGTITLNASQQQAMVISLTGILSTNPIVKFTEPGYWIIENLTSGAANFSLLAGGAATESISTAPGSRTLVTYDGTGVVRFVTGDEPGTFKKLCVSSVPLWISNCSVQPWLPCTGGTAAIATYPALAALLGIAFGNPGGGLFSLPDLRGRTDFDLDPTASRLNSFTMTPDGNTIGATGGLQANTLLTTNIPPLLFAGNAATWLLNQNNIWVNAGGGPTASGPGGLSLTTNQPSVTVTPSGSVNAGSPTTPISNMPPAQITGITFVKT